MYNNPILEMQNSLRNGSNQAILNPQMIQQFKTILQQLSSASNPQLMINNMLMTNPRLAQAFNLIRSAGGDPKTTFYNYARQMGVDPDNFINMLNKSLS